MAPMRKRKPWLRGYVTDIAVHWDQRVGRRRVTIRYEAGRILWSWPATSKGADEQRREAERWRRPDVRY